MRWGGEPFAEQMVRRNAMRDWHTIFAFVPHHLEAGPWVWLQRIERRALAFTFLGSPVWIYREIEA